jgi:hypothetical protein
MILELPSLQKELHDVDVDIGSCNELLLTHPGNPRLAMTLEILKSYRTAVLAEMRRAQHIQQS